MNDFGYESKEEYQDAYDDYMVHKLQEERAEVIYPARQTAKSYMALRKLIRKMVKEYMEEFYERDRQVESETSSGT